MQERLDLAQEFGAVPINGADLENALKVVREGTEGRGVDCALEAVGAQPTIKLAFDLIRMGGENEKTKKKKDKHQIMSCTSGWYGFCLACYKEEEEEEGRFNKLLLANKANSLCQSWQSVPNLHEILIVLHFRNVPSGHSSQSHPNKGRLIPAVWIAHQLCLTAQALLPSSHQTGTCCEEC